MVDESDNKKNSGLLKKLLISSAFIVPMIAYNTMRGFFDGRGNRLIENQVLSETFYYTTLIPAIGALGQIIPFRFDNMDPGCFSTLLSIPICKGLGDMCYIAGYSLGSMNS